MTTLWQDLRYGVRMLRKAPGFTATAALTLSLGIGANTAIFSVLDGVLLRPLPYHDADRLVIVWETLREQGRTHNPISPANYLDWRQQSAGFEDMAMVVDTAATLTGWAEAEKLAGQFVSPALFPILGADATLGRTFLADEGKPGDQPVVLISHGLWENRFGSQPDGRLMSILWWRYDTSKHQS